MADVQKLREKLGIHPDFPKKGINFLDIFPIFRDPILTELLISHLVTHIVTVTLANSPEKKIDAVVGLDARGFLLGPLIALRLGAGFVPVRKTGKLPGETVQVMYSKEYGTDEFAMQADSIAPGSNVIIVDDLIATGGSAQAAGELVKKLGGNTLEYIFIIGLNFLKDRWKLDAPVYCMIESDE
ncbi:adenine phosphoribosyltransferase [Serendipita sp. 396]|nr:adenine phosphoribosyltransferase [Serendipita sp. 396]KAG8779003.1 adenine phosphoribosyltransferase [Serendipita sp. 397]